MKRALTKHGIKKIFFKLLYELLKYLKPQNLSPVPLPPAMREIQGNMDYVLSGNDLRDDERDKRYFQLQNRYLALSLLTDFIASVY